MAAAALAPEALLHGAGVAPCHRQADQLAELRLDVRALGVRERLHVGDRVDDRHVGAADHDRQLHASADRAGRARRSAQGRSSCRVPMTAKYSSRRNTSMVDRAAVDGLLLGARRRAQRGERSGGVGSQARRDCGVPLRPGANATSLKPCRIGASRFQPIRVTEAVRRWRRQYRSACPERPGHRRLDRASRGSRRPRRRRPAGPRPRRLRTAPRRRRRCAGPPRPGSRRPRGGSRGRRCHRCHTSAGMSPSGWHSNSP